MNRYINRLALAGSLSLAGLALSIPADAWAQSSATATTMTEQPEAVRAVGEWNLDKRSKLAIQGYDPVAYFGDAGGKATKGLPSITSEYRGAVYRFANEANKQRFAADPAAFEPSHGGWCSWAIREGDKVEVDPESYIVKDGRLFLFYNGWLGNTRAKWLKGEHSSELSTADAEWLKLSGEKPAVRKAMSSEPAPATPADTKAGTPTAAATGALNTKLRALQDRYAVKSSPEQQAVSNAAIQTVADSGVLTRALAVGADAPNFELPDIMGEKQSLKAMLANGPVVMTFYRGGWCPFCATQLSAYQDSLAQMKSAGASVVAISPQTLENSKAVASSLKLDYTLLSDAGNAVAKQYGIAFTVPESVAPMYRPLLKKANGDESGELPLAATYIINRAGKVAYAFVDADYRKRAEPEAILAALTSLNAKE